MFVSSLLHVERHVVAVTRDAARNADSHDVTVLLYTDRGPPAIVLNGLRKGSLTNVASIELLCKVRGSVVKVTDGNGKAVTMPDSHRSELVQARGCLGSHRSGCGVYLT